MQACFRIGDSLTLPSSMASQLLPTPLRGLSNSSHATLAADPSSSLPPAAADPASDPFAAVYQQLLDSSSFQQLSSVVLPAGPLNVE